MRSFALRVLLLCAAVAPFAHADPITLRIATVAPDGTAWAREFRAWARDVELATEGKVRAKIYFGGIAGSEEQALARIRKDQLDGMLGSQVCTTLSPSLRVGRLVGVFQNRQENAYILSRLRDRVDAELLAQGFINLGEAGLGPELIFTTQPVADLAALRKLRFWVWQSDDVLPPQVRAMGIEVVQTPLESASRAFDDKRFDGFFTIPAAALAFQWTLQARYVTTLHVSFRSGCLLVSARTFDALPQEVQLGIRATTGKFSQRIEEQGARDDALLLGGLLKRQGLQAVAPSEQLRAEFLEAARAARPATHVVSDDLLRQLNAWLADYRAEHH
jgi:TRAP-type transport system periplasmic protein